MAVQPRDATLAVEVLGALVAERRAIPLTSLTPAEIRRRAGVRASDLAAALGVNPGTLSRWERGEWTPGPAHAEAWTAALETMSSAARS